MLENKKQDEQIIFDINIKTIDDLISILFKNEYDFLVIEPQENYIKIIFKKDTLNKETRYIKHPIYYNLLLNAKKISALNLEKNDIEQKGVGEYLFENKIFNILSKTIPDNFGEKLFIKIKIVEKKLETKKIKKSKLTTWSAFGFLGAFLFVSLIIGSVFLIFIVLNAQNPEDVSFFINLGINLNDINSFLLKLTTFVFSIFLLIQTILLIVTLFKTILINKKELQRKKIIMGIVSAVLLTITFTTGGLWIKLDGAIKTLPNWQEMSYGNIQIYDNNLLNTQLFDKSNSLITNYSNIIGPIDIKFDVNYLQKDEQRQGFKINKYIWDFGNGQKMETLIPEIIYNFDKKGNYKIKLTLEGLDKRFPDRITQKEYNDTPEIKIGYLVKINQNTLSNGGKTISFDATDLKSLGQIEWFLSEDTTNPVYVGYFFQPSKIYFEEEIIGMRIKNENKKGEYMNRIFTIYGEKGEISGKINFEVSPNNDLEYTFWLEDLENSFGDGFIENFDWIFGDIKINKKSNIINLEDSSKIKYNFTNYGKQDVKVILTNSAGKSTEIYPEKPINIQKKLELKNKIEIYDISGDLPKILDVNYNKNSGEYTFFGLSSPTNLKFDAKTIRPKNPLYFIQQIKWDLDNDGEYEKTGLNIEKMIYLPGIYEIPLMFQLVHLKDKENIIELKEKITLEMTIKEKDLILDIKPESEYVPTIVAFDASKSKVKDDNIVKFIYDYGDGIIEERDALNTGHKYLKEGNYKIKLTVVTQKGKEYSITKNLILKPLIPKLYISSSMKKAPINQEIDFQLTNSVGQIIGYHWDFGDGNFSNEANPSYAYKTPGKYKVKLTADFTNNNILIKEMEIEIINN